MAETGDYRDWTEIAAALDPTFPEARENLILIREALDAACERAKKGQF